MAMGSILGRVSEVTVGARTGSGRTSIRPCGELREAEGRNLQASASAAILDNQSVKTTSTKGGPWL